MVKSICLLYIFSLINDKNGFLIGSVDYFFTDITKKEKCVIKIRIERGRPIPSSHKSPMEDS